MPLDQPDQLTEALVSFDEILMPLLAALGLSLAIERILEFSKNIFEHTISYQFGRVIPKKKKAEQLLNDIEALHSNDKALLQAEADIIAIREKLKTEKGKKKIADLNSKLNELIKESELEETYDKSLLLVEPATDPDDGKTLKRFILQSLGIALGIIAANISGLELFRTFGLKFYGEGFPMSIALDHILTGLLIGGGTAPINTLISFITKRKLEVEKSSVNREEEDAKPLEIHKKPKISQVRHVVQPLNDEWVDIPYAGGVDKDVLENVHKRWKKNSQGKWVLIDPDMIIYHHTAMDSRSTFEDVVRVIKNRETKDGKKWITGYNCVITYDGVVHPFCRWDRRGNQAAGYNTRSLGITLNGNFEPNSGIPYSNPDGRYGAMKPSEIQLKMAARVVTLWTYLYNIKLDFNDHIIPHKNVSSKTCPGSGFPYDEFKQNITSFNKAWANSPGIQKRLDEYRLKPYIYS